MRIVLDLQAAQGESRFRGIGRYSVSLARSIIKNAGQHEIIIALSDLDQGSVEPLRGAFDEVLPQSRICVWQASGPTRVSQRGNEWRRSVAQEVREAFLARLQPDLIHVSNMLPGGTEDVVASLGPLTARLVTTVTLYDLIPLRYPDVYLGGNPAFARFYRERIEDLKGADGWLAISEWSAREGRELLGLRPDHVVNVSAASDDVFRKIAVSAAEQVAIMERLGLAKPFVMFSGGSDERKNLNRLIRAYAGLSAELRARHQLAIVGPIADPARLRAAAREAGLRRGELVVTGYVAETDLVRLYNLCRLFVLPSTHEGFGLPALEAMACEAPVIASHAASIPEVVGWDGALFDPLAIDDMRARMAEALTDDQYRAELVRRGTDQARSFSWAETGRRAVEAFERIYDDRLRQKSPSVSKDDDDPVGQLIDSIGARAVGQPTAQDLLRTARAISGLTRQGQRRLFVDVSQLVRHDPNTGVQRVVKNVLKCLPKVLPAGYQVEPVSAVARGPGYRTASVLADDDREGQVVDASNHDLFLGLDLSHRELLAQREYHAELRRLGVGVYFVVYDLLPVLMPEKFPRTTKAIHERWLAAIAKQDGALCISRSVADELAHWMLEAGISRHRPFRIGWSHPGADHAPASLGDGDSPGLHDLARRIAAGVSFLMVGTIEPRKGHAQALAAFDLLWARGLDVNLVLAGQRGWHMERFMAHLDRHPELNRRLHWIEKASDEELAQLYRASSCVVMASEGEGFGLPLIEAAQHGTPILARDIPVFREVAGASAMYFSGLDASDLADGILRWQRLSAAKALPQSSGIRWQTWQDTTAQIVEFLLGGRDYQRLYPTR